ncbi:MAG: class I SAM-dependent methyltransferase [Deltaproteobacteria bacterium]
MDNQISITAIMTAYMRAFHAGYGTPFIFNDYKAYEFIPEENRRLIEAGFSQALGFEVPPMGEASSGQIAAINAMMQFMGASNVLCRSQYAESNLGEAVSRGASQYIILGAGLDTFVFRRLDLVDKLQVFEVDHPLTQAFKRGRIAELGWTTPGNLHLVPVDFTRDSLMDSLRDASYRSDELSFFSWLGVIVYLPREQVDEAFRTIARSAQVGSTIVFDYMDIAAFNREKAAASIQANMDTVREIGEPMLTGFDPDTLGKELYGLGWDLQENLGPADIEQRYFGERSDGWHASNHSHLAKATVR